MKIGNAGNVSFGKLIEKHEARMTNRQIKIRDMIYDSFDKQSNYSESPFSIEQYIANEMGADIFVTYKENNSVEMKLQESEEWLNGEWPKSTFAQNKDKWLKDKDRKPVTISKNDSYDKIGSKIDSYAEGCDQRAFDYENLNEKLAIESDGMANADYSAWLKKHPNATETEIIKYFSNYGEKLIYNEKTGKLEKPE